MATRPATMPEAMPTEVALPCVHRSMIIHVNAAAAAVLWVVAKAGPATVSESGLSTATAEPALDPNQPNPSRPAPVSVSARLFGKIAEPPAGL